MGLTLFEKLWRQHEISQLNDTKSLLYIDRIFLHERTGSFALTSLERNRRSVRRREHTFCTMDHIVDTFPGRGDDTLMPSGREFIIATRSAANFAGIKLFDIQDPSQGIVHVISPELGIALPGTTLICPDSHTCTLGGIGALAWGVGSTEAEHALATSTLRVDKPATMRVNFVGKKPIGVTAKDIALYAIRTLSSSGGSGFAIEFAGEAIRNLTVEERLTLCNMATELSAFTALIAPDEQVFSYFDDKLYAPQKAHRLLALEHWMSLTSDSDAHFDREEHIDISGLKPQISWGISPEHCIDFDALIPNPRNAPDPYVAAAWQRALDYMELKPGGKLSDYEIDAAFLGSCTNSRLSDLQLAADYLDFTGATVSDKVKALCVPGSGSVKRAAEGLGLDKIFLRAGFEWREPGCSMCFFAGGETLGDRVRVASTTNRNFEGRQGPGVKTHLASPLSVVASACAGRLVAAEQRL